jgi:hypothetical protein
MIQKLKPFEKQNHSFEKSLKLQLEENPNKSEFGGFF